MKGLKHNLLLMKHIENVHEFNFCLRDWPKNFLIDNPARQKKTLNFKCPSLIK